MKENMNATWYIIDKAYPNIYHPGRMENGREHHHNLGFAQSEAG